MTWHELWNRLVWALDRPATRILFGLLLPVTCFALLPSLSLLVFALTICAAMTWSILRGARPRISVVLCALGLMLVPMAAMGVFVGLAHGMWQTVALGLLGFAPIPAAVVSPRS